MIKITRVLKILIASLFIFFPLALSARENITDWYIKDFQSEIRVNKDSTLLITENITADCGNLPNKHGIFRVLPTVWKTTSGTVSQPVELVSITDFNGKALNYQTSNDSANNTITWKIGDANKTVTGVNYYRITYKVKNAIIFQNPEFDEWYWNITGNFWDIEMDKFSVKIIFPEEVDNKTSQVEYYTGTLNNKDKSLAKYQWTDKNILEFTSLGTMPARQGVTVSVTFPKNIFTPSQPTAIQNEKTSSYVFLIFALILLFPIVAFAICFILWWKYGKDPKVDKTIIPEFGIPDNITPLQMGMVISNGSLKNEIISASLINMAVKGIIKIEETEEKVLFWNSKDLKITLIDRAKLEANDPTEKLILNKMLSGEDSVQLSSLKNSFASELQEIKKKAAEDVENNGWINKRGLTYRTIFFVISFALVFLGVWFIVFGGIGLILSAPIFFVFAFFMPQRTPAGAELLWKIKGFKLYMETAEKYRQQFYEKENIFEKFLPYAMAFGMTKLWIQKMKEIYGEDYFKTYHPIWYVGSAGSFTSFDADSFTSQMNSISSSISSNVSSGSGAGGGGGSGGGGGGGGGGGW